MDYILEMKDRVTFLKNKIGYLEKQLKTMPQGRVQDYVLNDYHRYYLVIQNHGEITRKYLGRKDHELIRTMMLKAIYAKELSNSKRELRGIQYYIRQMGKISDKGIYIYKKEGKLIDELRPELSKRILQVVCPQEARKWERADYEINENYRENLKVRTKEGLFVRSKSEAFIMNCLYEEHIPHRYECKLDFEDMSFYPDITILHPSSGEIYIWEHLGMLDDMKYFENAMNKLYKYIRNGYIPTRNLILTCETSESPLDIRYVRELIRFYFKNNV